jgi:hypothetical protein
MLNAALAVRETQQQGNYTRKFYIYEKGLSKAGRGRILWLPVLNNHEVYPYPFQ